MNDQRKIIYGETESGNPPCPECGRDDWNEYGCMACGLEFFPPSEAYQAAIKTPVSGRIEALYKDLDLTWEPVALTPAWVSVSPAPAWGPQPVTPPTPAQKRCYRLLGIPVGSRHQLPELPASASPIEQKFWGAYLHSSETRLDGLTPQHRVGRYKIDFALPDSLIGIELDGHASHSSTKAIAHDRKRQRELETLGWRIIRFGGSEVHQDAPACVRQAAELADHIRKG